MADSNAEKKHDPTPYRRQKAREQGQVARSQDLGSALVLLISVAVLWWTGPGVAGAIVEVMRGCFTQTRFWTFDSRSAARLTVEAMQHGLWALMPLLMGVCVIVAVNNWFQVGFLFLPQKLGIDWKRIDPLKGAQRLVALPNLARLGFGLLKVALVTLVISLGLWGRWEVILSAQALTTGEIGQLVWQTLLDICLRTGLVLLLLAILDYGFQRWKFERDLKMTDEELREEMKMMNGDPQIVARRRAVQRQLMLNRIQAAVPEADVVITNPTELAVAVKFDSQTMTAPIVLAKGAGHVAARIRKLALEATVPIVERKPLAQVLYQTVEVGESIPVEQYAAVAEVLRYVYQLQGKKLPSLDRQSEH